MATQLYRVRLGVTATNNGRELIDTLEQIGDRFARLKRLFAAMTEEKDGTLGDATDYVTVAATFGITDLTDTLSPTVAQAAYNELNSFLGNAGPALEQCCARFKQ